MTVRYPGDDAFCHAKMRADHFHGKADIPQTASLLDEIGVPGVPAALGAEPIGIAPATWHDPLTTGFTESAFTPHVHAIPKYARNRDVNAPDNMT